MSRQVIGIIAESYEDFRKHIDPLIDRTVKPEKDTVKIYCTKDIWYHAITSPLSLCGITVDDVLVTENAYKVKRIPDTLFVLKANLRHLPLKRILELTEIFEKLETDYENNLK